MSWRLGTLGAIQINSGRGKRQRPVKWSDVLQPFAVRKRKHKSLEETQEEVRRHLREYYGE